MKKSVLFLFVLLTAAHHLPAQKLYWLDSFLSSSWRTGPDLGNIQQLTPPIGGKLTDFAIDPAGQKIYYAVDKFFDDQKPYIIRTALDGTGLQIVVPTTEAGLPKQLALDTQNDMVYWTSGAYPDVSIHRAGLDGSNSGVVVDLSGSNSPKGLALDVAGGKIYWTLEYKGTIFFADLDGSNPGSFPGTDNSDEYAIDLALHPAEGKLYWVTAGSFGEPSKVRKANMDGTGLEAIASLGTKTPLCIEVDTANNKVYWTLWLDELVQRCNLDGSDKEDYFNPEDYIDPTNVGDVSELAFDYAVVSAVEDVVAGQAAGFGLVPNPVAGGSVSLVFPPTTAAALGDLEVRVFDALGRLEMREVFPNEKAVTLGHHLQAGIHHVVCFREGRPIGAQRLVVE